MRAFFYILAVLIAFAAVAIYGSLTGSGLQAGLNDIMEAAKTPGGMILIADLYAGFLILCGWYFYRDGFGIKAIILSILTLGLGNFVPLIYILFLLARSKGDVWQTLLGRNT